MSLQWINSGLSFQTATEAGDFLMSQGFNVCPGGFERADDLDGGRVFASYVLTMGRCFIRFGADVPPSDGGLQVLNALNEHARPWNWDDEDQPGEPGFDAANAWRMLDTILAKPSPDQIQETEHGLGGGV